MKAIEQLSYFDLPSLFSYEEDLPGGHIYPKIDTLTFVFKDTTINRILRWLKLDDSVGEFIQSLYKQDSGLVPSFVFTYNNIRIEAAQIGFYHSDLETPMFDVVCPSIRLYLGGEALDYLRSLGIDFIDYRWNVPDLGPIGAYHCTRVDWAFDFVDYKPDFLDQLITFLQNNELPSGRVPLKKSAIKYSLKLGSEKTVYLGSTQGSKLLRCYDKKKQYFNPDTGLWVQCPYGDCESWYRIEWQLRNDDAHGTLFSRDVVNNKSFEFEDILKSIYEYYQFTCSDHDVFHNGARPDLGFWQTFLPWDEVKCRIVQNAKYVQSTDRVQKVTTFFEHSALRNYMLYMLIYGQVALNQKCEEYLRSMDFENDIEDPTSAKRRQAFFSMVEEVYQITGNKIPSSRDGNGLYLDFGRLHWWVPTYSAKKGAPK